MKKKNNNRISIVPFLVVMFTAVVLIFAVNRAGQEEKESSSLSSSGLSDISGTGISDISGIGISDFLPDDTKGTTDGSGSGASDSTSSASGDSSASGTTDQSTSDTSEEAFSSLGYHYDQLDSPEQEVYSERLTALQARENHAEVDIIPEDSLMKIFSGILYDHPEIFWIDNSVSFSYSSNVTSDRYEIGFEFTDDVSDIDTQAAAIEAAVSPVVAQIDSIADDYDKVTWIYEYLTKTVTYKAKAENSQNIRSTFLNHETVCAGYSLAFKYLCDRVGIPCVVMTGVAGGDFHEWNVVRVGDDWGYVDVTWGDTDDDFVCTHSYLELTSDEMKRSGHTVTDGYSYPSVTGTGMDYFRRNNLLYGELSTDKLSEIIGEAYNAGKSGVEMKFDSKDHYTSALAAVSDGSANNAIANVYLSSGIFNYQTWYLSYDDLYVIQEIWKN